MNELKRSAVILFLCTGISTCFSQPTNPEIRKELAKKYTDEPCIATKEEVRLTFGLVRAPKKENLVISENFYSKQFTPENFYTKKNVVTYDDYSTVKNIVAKKNGIAQYGLAIVHTNYEKAEVFHDDVKLCGYTMEMQKNNDFEYSYTKDYSNPRLFSRLYFHDSYPMEEKTIVFEIPEWVDLEIKEFNFDGYKITKKDSMAVQKKMRILTYRLTSLQAIPQENHKPSLAKTHPHLMVIVKSFKGKISSENYFSTHSDIYKWCKMLVDSVDNKPEVFADKLKEIAGDEKDSVHIMEKVFYWVQDHVRYIAFEDGIMGYKPQAASKVYNLLYGDCKGMANLTKCMLRSLGFDARLTWIGTNDIPYNNDIPALGVYNHMICTVFLGGKKYFLDGTETFIALDDYAERIQDRPVMIENGTSYLTDKIPGFAAERNKRKTNTVLTISGSVLKGTNTLSLNGEEKTGFLRSVNEIKTENQSKAIKRYLGSEKQGISILSYTTSGLSERKMPLVITSEFEMKDRVLYTKDKKEILLLPDKEGEFQNFIFDTTRLSDYEFNNRYYLSSEYEINIPQGYTVKSLPASVSIDNEGYGFSLAYATEGNVIRMKKDIVIKKTEIKKSAFNSWNDDVKKLKNFYNEPVILKQ